MLFVKKKLVFIGLFSSLIFYSILIGSVCYTSHQNHVQFTKTIANLRGQIHEQSITIQKLEFIVAQEQVSKSLVLPVSLPFDYSKYFTVFAIAVLGAITIYIIFTYFGAPGNPPSSFDSLGVDVANDPVLTSGNSSVSLIADLIPSTDLISNGINETACETVLSSLNSSCSSMSDLSPPCQPILDSVDNFVMNSLSVCDRRSPCEWSFDQMKYYSDVLQVMAKNNSLNLKECIITSVPAEGLIVVTNTLTNNIMNFHTGCTGHVARIFVSQQVLSETTNLATVLGGL